MMPLGRGRENSSSGVFFTVPCAVAMNTKCSWSNSFTGTTAVIFSPCSIGNRLTIGLPRLVRLPAGTSNTLSQRSEEHTSELQSHSDLVCRLLLEKKKEDNTESKYQNE